MADPATAFLLLGGILIVGFLAAGFFERTKIPDILILILLGILLGPVFGVVEPAGFFDLLPFFAPLALLILLFEGGVNFNLHRLLTELSKATVFTVTVLVFEVLLVTFAATFFFGWEFLHALLLGAVVGGTSSAVVIPLLQKVKGDDDSKAVLNLESALTDALVVVLAITVMQVILSNTFDVSVALNALLGSFSIAAVVGIASGLAWLRVLNAFKGKPFGYLLTLAVLFILYGFVETVKGNGAIAALVFGVIIGNAKELSRFVGLTNFEAEEAIRHFQTEVSFFIRTFFFVFVGLLFSPASLTFNTLLLLAFILAAIVAGRFLAVKALARLGQTFKSEFLVQTMMPRGLAAVVLATLPATSGVFIPYFTDLVMLVVIATTLITTIGVFYWETNGRVRTTSAAPAPAKKPKIVNVK